MATREELTAAIDEAVKLLRALDQSHWAASLDRDRDLVAKGDFRGVERLVSTLGAGGPGSLSDLMFPDRDGSSRNPQLDKALDTAFEIARELQREEDRREAI